MRDGHFNAERGRMKMLKKNIVIFFNLFFIGIMIYALVVFMPQRGVDPQKIIQNSVLKGKTFDAKVEEIVSNKGIKALFLEENSAPLVAIDFCFEKAGYAFDRVHKKGLAHMAGEMLDYGAGAFDNRTYHDVLEENAIELSFSVSDDSFFGSMTTPRQNLDIALKVLKAVLSEPHIKPKYLEIVRTQQLESIKMQSERPEKVLYRKFKDIFYGDHPLKYDALGVAEDVAGITEQNIKNFLRSHLTKDNLLVAVAGDISKEDAADMLDVVFADLKKSSDIKALSETAPNYHFKEQNIDRQMPQVIATFVAPGVPRSADDFYALYMANEAFGGSGLFARLNLIARQKEGLTYGADTYLNTNRYAPRIEGSFSTSAENYPQMREIVLKEWQKMADEGLSQEEFELVKNDMLISFNLRFMSLSSISKQLLYMQKEHLGLDFLQKRNEYVKNTTLAEVNAAAKKYFGVMPSVLTIGNNAQQGEK